MRRSAAVLAHPAWFAALALALAACVRPGEDRAAEDLLVGQGSGGGLDVVVEDGQAQIRHLDRGELVLWAQAPVFRLAIHTSDRSVSGLFFTVDNCMPGAELTAIAGDPGVVPLASPRPTLCRWQLDLPAAAELVLEVAPADARIEERWHFAVMGDIQTALDRVHEIFERMNLDSELRFVVSTGDLVEDGRHDEYELLLSQLAVLDIPYFSTIGNHELTRNIDVWHQLFGRYNVHFDFKGVYFSFLDSGNASIDPQVYERLDGWIEAARGRVHVFGTHYPPFDPVGVRAGSFRSRKEATKLVTRLAEGEVDVTFYGHIHSYYAYSNAGIPAFISGGGGALPERFDGIDRHYLKVEVDPARGVEQAGLVRVD